MDLKFPFEARHIIVWLALESFRLQIIKSRRYYISQNSHNIVSLASGDAKGGNGGGGNYPPPTFAKI